MCKGGWLKSQGGVSKQRIVAVTPPVVPGNGSVSGHIDSGKTSYRLDLGAYFEGLQSKLEVARPSSSPRRRSSMLRLLRATYSPVDGSVNDAVSTAAAHEKDSFPGRRGVPSSSDGEVRKAQSSGNALMNPGAEAPDDDVPVTVVEVEDLGSGNEAPTFPLVRRPPLKCPLWTALPLRPS
jgi:hypothetical protein